MQLVIDLPPRQHQLAFNRRRWADVLADRGLADLPYRIETNLHGQIIMTPPPSGRHSARQGKITVLLDRLLGGNALPECPISTVDGVKAADVGWYSDPRFAEVKEQMAFEKAPEICVEVLSPSNTDVEMQQRRELYFDAGAEEVWICSGEGKMSFFLVDNANQPAKHSTRCPQFPSSI
jgi:Uma2 family endonuclease